MSLFARPPSPLPCQRLAPRCRRYSAKTATKTKAELKYRPGANLPEPWQWKEAFSYVQPGMRDRVSIKNPATADKLAKSFIYWNWSKMDVKSEDSASPEGEYAEEGEQATASSSASVLDPETKKGKVVIEAFPGPGALTRALMRLPKERIRRLIVLEENEMYYEYLKPLEDLDPRVKILKKSGYAWDTYEVIEENGWLDDVKKAPWDVVQTDLQFISHVPTNIMGEQLVAQFFRCIPDRQWLFKYGRMPMSIVLGAWMWKRLSAAPGTAERCKVSVIAEAVSTFTSSLPPSTLLPYEEHFHPVFSRESRQSKPELRKHGSPLLSINILPFAKQPIEKGALEKWDFCLRRLFVLKSTPIGKAIGSLAPGATTLIQYLSDESLPAEERLDLKKPIKQLTVHDWSLVLRAFERWPFAPEDLLITDAFHADREVGKRH